MYQTILRIVVPLSSHCFVLAHVKSLSLVYSFASNKIPHSLSLNSKWTNDSQDLRHAHNLKNLDESPFEVTSQAM